MHQRATRTSCPGWEKMDSRRVGCGCSAVALRVSAGKEDDVDYVFGPAGPGAGYIGESEALNAPVERGAGQYGFPELTLRATLS